MQSHQKHTNLINSVNLEKLKTDTVEDNSMHANQNMNNYILTYSVLLPNSYHYSAFNCKITTPNYCSSFSMSHAY